MASKLGPEEHFFEHLIVLHRRLLGVLEKEELALSEDRLDDACDLQKLKEKIMRCVDEQYLLKKQKTGRDYGLSGNNCRIYNSELKEIVADNKRQNRSKSTFCSKYENQGNPEKQHAWATG